MARTTEEQLQRGDSLLINAVEFRDGVDVGSPRLRESVVGQADEEVRSLAAADMTPASPALRAMAIAAGALVLFAGAMLSAPRLFATVVPRYLDPLGDHPAYTLLRFHPTITPEPLHRGRAASIRVEITGPEVVEQAVLVTRPLNDRDAGLQEVPMFRQEEQTYSAQLARVDEDLAFHVRTPRGRSEWFPLRVSDVPLLEEARATFHFPSYTGWKPREQGLDERGFRGMMGTRVQLTIRSNLPLESGEFRFFDSAKDGQGTPAVVPLRRMATEPDIVVGEFVIDRTGRFELQVRSTAAKDSDVLSGPVIAIPDRAPLVTVTSPAATLLAVEGWKVPVEIQASDDVGISRIRLFRGVNGWSPSAVTLSHQSDDAGVALAKAEFDLGELGAKAGDFITYYASADEIAETRPQSADSATCTIQVISEEEYRDFARQQYQLAELTEEFESFRKELDRLNEERQRATEKLEELLKKQESGQPLTDADRDEMQRLQKQLEDFARETAELARTLEERAEDMQLYDFEQQYTEELQQLAKDLSQQSTEAERLAELLRQQQSSSSPKLADELRESAEQFLKEAGPFDESSRQELEALGDDLELLQKAEALNEQVERLQAVSAQQRELANRMAELAGKSSLTPDEQARADGFAKQQELLAQEMESIERDLQQAAEQAEESLPQMAGSAQQLLQTLSQLGIPREQLAAAEQARGQQGDAAHRHAEAAARKLESLMQAAGEMQQSDELQQGLDGPLGMSRQQLKNTLQQLRRGRRPPGLGQRGGNGQQSGDGESSGDGQGRASGGGGQPGGQRGRVRPGQSNPQGDSDAQMLGPRTQEAVESSDKSATMQAESKTRFVVPGVAGDGAGTESMSPGSRSMDGFSGPNLRGVPVGYRDAAEAYFRRLSEGKRSQ